MVRVITNILLIFFVSNVLGQEAKMGQVLGRPVEMTLVKAEDLSPAPWPNELIELKQTTAAITSDMNIYMLLQARGVAPDSGAFAIVYDLNPTIRDINSVALNTVLQLPTIGSAPGLRRLLQNRELVQLTLDPEVRRQLNHQIEALRPLTSSIDQITSDSDVQEHIKSLIAWYQQVEQRFKRRTEPPLRQATILELLQEADVLHSILERALQQHRKLGDGEQSQIAAIYGDLKREMTQYDQVLSGSAPKAEGLYSVTVNINGTNSMLIEGLRVYYTYNGLFRPLPAEPPITSHGFTNLGSGNSENLLMKNYWLWAAKDGDSNHPVTPPYRLDITAATPTSITVGLSLNRGGQQ